MIQLLAFIALCLLITGVGGALHQLLQGDHSWSSLDDRLARIPRRYWPK
jgi:hypothetical protein